MNFFRRLFSPRVEQMQVDAWGEPMEGLRDTPRGGKPALSAGHRVMACAARGRDARSSGARETAPGFRDGPHTRVGPETTTEQETAPRQCSNSVAFGESREVFREEFGGKR